MVITKFAHPSGEFLEGATLAASSNSATGNNAHIFKSKMVWAQGQANPLYVLPHQHSTYYEADLTGRTKWVPVIINMDADLNLQWARALTLSSPTILTAMSALFFDPTPAHADGPHLIVELGHRSDYDVRHLVTIKASDGEMTGYFPHTAIYTFTGPAYFEERDHLALSQDGNSFYYLARFYPTDVTKVI
jgi:hypothetical protein